MQDPSKFWPDGTPKSQDNVFTAHRFTPGQRTAPAKTPTKRRPGGFARNHGAIAGGLGRANDLRLTRRARA